jgi:hypothetical protein
MKLRASNSKLTTLGCYTVLTGLIFSFLLWPRITVLLSLGFIALFFAGNLVWNLMQPGGLRSDDAALLLEKFIAGTIDVEELDDLTTMGTSSKEVAEAQKRFRAITRHGSATTAELKEGERVELQDLINRLRAGAA